ncbi:MAG: sulfotransferase [Hyphomicrobiales bacterium]
MKQPRIFLIGIGAQKAGTTWLANYMRGHPDIFMSPLKEMHFWDTKYYQGDEAPFDWRFKVRLAKLQLRQEAGLKLAQREARHLGDLSERVAIGTDTAAYYDFFARRAGAKDVWAEFTPSYALLDKNGFAAMARIAPETRFVFLMRNPADRYWSHVRYVAQEIPETDTVREFDSGFDRPEYRLRGDYARTIEELLAAVPRAHVFVEFHERLFGEASIRRFCDFLSVRHLAPDLAPRKETAVKLNMSDGMRRRVYREFAQVYRFADEFCGGEVPQSWRDDMLRYG